MGPIGFLRTSIGNYQSALRNILEKRRYRSQNASVAQLKNFRLEYYNCAENVTTKSCNTGTLVS
jgi:hypothetical protein